MVIRQDEYKNGIQRLTCWDQGRSWREVRRYVSLEAYQVFLRLRQHRVPDAVIREAIEPITVLVGTTEPNGKGC